MAEERSKVTILDLQDKKARGVPITMVTAYDYPTALLVDRAGLDIILVGDSLAMVVLGHTNTVSVTLEEMLHHCRAVSKGAKYPLLVGDMPFMSYQVSKSQAIENAGRFLKEAGMDVIKLEGGRDVAPTVEAIVTAGIPVVAHIGLTPQTVSKLGGFKVQGKTIEAARGLIDDALALEDAGAFCIILEAIPDRVAQLITERVKIPTIGIGAGIHCDGQVLVLHDMIGLFDRFTPKFVKRYVNVFPELVAALQEYGEDVVQRRFPEPKHGFTIKEDVYQALLAELEERAASR